MIQPTILLLMCGIFLPIYCSNSDMSMKNEGIQEVLAWKYCEDYGPRVGNLSWSLRIDPRGLEAVCELKNLTEGLKYIIYWTQAKEHESAKVVAQCAGDAFAPPKAGFACNYAPPLAERGHLTCLVKTENATQSRTSCFSEDISVRPTLIRAVNASIIIKKAMDFQEERIDLSIESVSNETETKHAFDKSMPRYDGATEHDNASKTARENRLQRKSREKSYQHRPWNGIQQRERVDRELDDSVVIEDSDVEGSGLFVTTTPDGFTEVPFEGLEAHTETAFPIVRRVFAPRKASNSTAIGAARTMHKHREEDEPDVYSIEGWAVRGILIGCSVAALMMAGSAIGTALVLKFHNYGKSSSQENCQPCGSIILD